MSREPIYVYALTKGTAEDFIVHDMHEDHRRLRYINDVDNLRGLQCSLVYVLPSAVMRNDFDEILEMIKSRGFVIARVEDCFARSRYNRERL